MTTNIATQTVQIGLDWDTRTGAVTVPIYQTATFRHPGLGQSTGYDYTRSGNPTRQSLEEGMARLDNGCRGFAYATGMAAITSLLLLFRQGDHIVVTKDLYGGTYRLFDRVLRPYGLDFSFVDTTRLEDVQSGLRPNTRMLWLETPSNPLLRVSDISALAEIAHHYSSQPLVVVDNTFATPYLQRPLELGADLVVHSTTKYLGGHSDVVGGAIVAREETWHERLAFLQNAVGAVPGPMDCFLILRGIKTLPIRMQRHAENAAAIARFLGDHPRVKSVYYPFHATHPQVKLARRQMFSGGGMLSFTVKGGASEAQHVAESTHLFALAESLGGVESLIEVPAAMTHASTAHSPLAVSTDLIRLSVGIENLDDLLADLAQALG